MKASTIISKWMGESEKLVTALFSLARRLAPTVIFVDEIDTLLKNRSGGDNQGNMSASLGLFMSEWDGLQSNPSDNPAPVVLVGATNRPDDLDPAFRRRMPLTVQTLVPNADARADILRIYLRFENMHSDVSLEKIASDTEGFTGAELKELCRLVSLARLKQATARNTSSRATDGVSNNNIVDNNSFIDHLKLKRELNESDFQSALRKMHESRAVINDFSVDGKPKHLSDSNELLARYVMTS